jgi:hypothetical protein
MKTRTNFARIAFAAVAIVSLGGCTVSRNQYLNTAYGPGQSPATYRVGGPRQDTQVESKVTIIRHANDTPATQPAGN